MTRTPVRRTLDARLVVTWPMPVWVHALLSDALSGGFICLLSVTRPEDTWAIAHLTTSRLNEQSPGILTPEALNGEDFSQAHAEHHHTARPAIKGASGGPAT